MVAVWDRLKVVAQQKAATTGSGDIKLDTPPTTTVSVQLIGPGGVHVIHGTQMTMLAPTVAKIKAAIANPSNAEAVAPMVAGDESWPVSVKIVGRVARGFSETRELPEGAAILFVDP